MSLLFRRFSILQDRRSNELHKTWMSSIDNVVGKHWLSAVKPAMEQWAGSAKCTTRASLDNYLVGKDCSTARPPWDALKQVLDELPTKLE